MNYKTLVLVAGTLMAAPAFANDDANAADQIQAISPATTEPSTNTGTIARSALTTGVEDREPVDSINRLTAENEKIYYFTELKDMEGQQVAHRWEYMGQVMAEVPFNVGGARWRIYSSKKLDSDWQGEWKVSVVDANGGTLGVNTFTYKTDGATPQNKPVPPSVPAQ